MFNNPLRLAALFGVAIITLVITSGDGNAAPRKSCVLAGGEATMVTRGLAEFMANAAMKNSMKKMDATATGPVMLKCNDPAPLTYCKAQQRACK